MTSSFEEFECGRSSMYLNSCVPGFSSAIQGWPFYLRSANFIRILSGWTYIYFKKLYLKTEICQGDILSKAFNRFLRRELCFVALQYCLCFVKFCCYVLLYKIFIYTCFSSFPVCLFLFILFYLLLFWANFVKFVPKVLLLVAAVDLCAICDICE